MKMPGCTVVLTINERPTEVMDRVFHSLARDNGPHTGGWDRLVIVQDRTPPHLRAWIADWWKSCPAPVDIVTVDGAAGWLCPVRAWNAGLSMVETEITYCLSSETIQAPHNVAKVKALLGTTQAVVFGAARESEPDRYGHSVSGGVLCSSEVLRPLGFVMAMPTWMVRATGGYDEGFMGGYWYDDDDFTFRLWRLGLPYVFSDAISGVHQSHPRPVLDTQAGKDGIARNRQYITSKHGSFSPWADDVASGNVTLVKRPGLTVLFPHTGPGLLDARVRAWELPTHPDGKMVVVH